MSPFVNVKQRAGRPRVRVQGQVAVLCLLPSRNLSRLPSSPQRGFQPQTSPRPDKAVTALLRGGGGGGGWVDTHGGAERGFAGTFFAAGQDENNGPGVLAQACFGKASDTPYGSIPRHRSCFLRWVFSKSTLLLQCQERSSVKYLSIHLKSNALCFQC